MDILGGYFRWIFYVFYSCIHQSLYTAPFVGGSIAIRHSFDQERL